MFGQTNMILCYVHFVAYTSITKRFFIVKGSAFGLVDTGYSIY